MIVIADTTPLISLLKIDRLDLLEKLFKQILVPEAVYNELVSNSKFKVEAKKIELASYIMVTEVENRDSVRIFRKVTGLDAGESEAIVLADKMKADLLLMDEIKGRLVAKRMELKIMGTIGILLAAYESGLLENEEVENYIEVLRKSGRHISEKLYKQLLEKIEDN